MIQTNELRIGNYLHYKDTDFVATVELIHGKNHFDCRDEFGSFTPNNKYQPIPLTEEWLLKFGVIKYQESSGYKGYVLDDFEIGYSGNGYYYSATNRHGEGNEPVVEIKSVHQLQNLYFALTQEELCLKP